MPPTDFLSRMRTFKTVRRAEPLLGLALGRRGDFFLSVGLDVIFFLALSYLSLWALTSAAPLVSAGVLQCWFQTHALESCSLAGENLLLPAVLFGTSFTASYFGCRRTRQYLLQHSALLAAATVISSGIVWSFSSAPFTWLVALVSVVVTGNYLGYRGAFRALRRAHTRTRKNVPPDHTIAE